MRSFPDVQAAAYAQHLETADARIAALEAENARLREALLLAASMAGTISTTAHAALAHKEKPHE